MKLRLSVNSLAAGEEREESARSKSSNSSGDEGTVVEDEDAFKESRKRQ